MSLTIVVGGQFGGEGKGVVTSALAYWDSVKVLVKTGGPNSAHTFGFQGKKHTLRMLPSAAAINPEDPDVTLVFPAGCLVYYPQLQKEISNLDFKGRIIIDSHAGVIEQEHVQDQMKDVFYNHVGSSRTGTGKASAERSRRRLRLAGEVEEFREFIGDTQQFLAESISLEQQVLVEGCQGYGLSNYHGDYPYVSSRDNTVNGLMAQIGLGPKMLKNVILAIKCFPTRNQDGKGSIRYELPDKLFQKYDAILSEKGGGGFHGGDQQRRVARFDFELVHQAILANTPDMLALTGLDKLKVLLQEPSIQKHYRVTTPEEFVELLEGIYQLPVMIQSRGLYLDNVTDWRQKEVAPK